MSLTWMVSPSSTVPKNSGSVRILCWSSPRWPSPDLSSAASTRRRIEGSEYSRRSYPYLTWIASSKRRISIVSTSLGSLGIVFRLEMGGKQGDQARRIDRFGEIVGRSRLEAFLAVALHGLGGQGDDRQRAKALVLPDAPHGLV